MASYGSLPPCNNIRYNTIFSLFVRIFLNIHIHVYMWRKPGIFLMSNISYMTNRYQNNSKHNWFRFLYVHVHVCIWRTKTYACYIYLKNWTCLMEGQGHPWWATFDRTNQCREMGTRLYVCMWICIYRHRYVNLHGNNMSCIWSYELVPRNGHMPIYMYVDMYLQTRIYKFTWQ